MTREFIARHAVFFWANGFRGRRASEIAHHAFLGGRILDAAAALTLRRAPRLALGGATALTQVL